MSRYLITGGAGFIGSHLADALLKGGHDVRILDDLSTGSLRNLAQGVELVVGDVADALLVRRTVQDVQGVFHLAAVASTIRSNQDWIGTHRANQTGTISILDAARDAGGIPVVYASSAAIYGNLEGVPAREGMRAAPLSAYGADKLGSELHAAVAASVHGMATVGLRFFNVYGPRQDPSSPYSGVISRFMGQAISGTSITIHGDGDQTRDLIYVSDVVAHLVASMNLLKLIDSPISAIYNVCTGLQTSVIELAHKIITRSGKRIELIYTPSRAGDIRNSLGDPRLAMSALGLSAKTTLAEGINVTYNSIISQIEETDICWDRVKI